MQRRATIIGSGPNGLVAAVTLARAGYAVRVVESAATAGGSARTAELTLPGFRHDVGSAVHPVAVTSPWFRAFGMDRRVEWIVPDASFAHPLPAGPAAIAWRDIERTAAALGADGPRWRRMIAPLRDRLDEVVAFTGDQLLRMPRHPLTVARFGARALTLGGPAAPLALRTQQGRALWAGVAAHAPGPLPSVAGAAAGLLLAAHAHSSGGWPVPRGGAQAITDALLADLRAHGGTVECGVRVDDLARFDVGDLASGDLLLLAGAPRLAASLPGIPPSYARALARYRYGAGIAKIDLALSGPVPWTDPDVGSAPTVHLAGDAGELRRAEAAVVAGRHAEAPAVLVTQPTVVDPTRAPAGAAVLWAYVHVPAGSTRDPSEGVLAQLERFAPGVRDLILAQTVTTAADLATGNPAALGGDGLGGAFTLRQAVRRPTLSSAPWRTPMRGVYLASAATPPGPGVHGMPGWHAAATALTDATGRRPTLGELFPGT